MKKIAVISIIALFLGSVHVSAQFNVVEEIQVIEEVQRDADRDALIRRFQEYRELIPIKFQLRAEGVWAPFVFRGYGDLSQEGLLQDDPLSPRSGSWGPNYGVGGGPGNDIRALTSFRLWGTDPTQRVGLDISIRGDIGLNADTMSYVWAWPFREVLRVFFGQYNWTEMQGRIDGIGSFVGNYGISGADRIFQPVASDLFGALFIFTPPSIAPSWIQGLMAYVNFGVTGRLDPATGQYLHFAARSPEALKQIFSTPHTGIGYRHDSLGMVRIQYIASTYMWGGGFDYAKRVVSYPWYGTSLNTFFYPPRRAQTEARLEMALNITAVSGINMDMGFSLPFAVTVRNNDDGIIQGTTSTPHETMLGPSWVTDLGWRGRRNSWSGDLRMASTIGDVWRAPTRIAFGMDFRPQDLSELGIRFVTQLEFGEEIAFVDGSPNYKAGFKWQLGVQPSYLFSFGSLAMNVGFRFHQNDHFRQPADLDNSNFTLSAHDMAIAEASLRHNGIFDLGLGLFFTKTIVPGASFRVGIAMSIPVGGDRYNWSTDDPDSIGLEVPEDIVYFGRDFTDRFKQGNFVIIIPIVLSVTL